MPPRLRLESLMNQGSATSDLWWFIAIITALGIIWFATGGPNRPEAWAGPFIQPPAPIGTGEIYRASLDESRRADRGTSGESEEATDVNYYQNSGPDTVPIAGRSQWYGQVSIDTGNGPYEIQPNQEYIALEAGYNNQKPITVTGWGLANGKNRFTSIPQATRLFIIGGSANSATVPITLAPGGRLVLTTGNMPNSDIKANFLTNKCTGYLGALPDYQFTPALDYSCPNPAKDPGVRNLDKECYDFVLRLNSCHTPKVERDSDGYEFIDGVSGLPSYCRAFLEEHFNYNACVKWHEQDPDFYGNEWRVYLHQTWELWAENREQITLYDQFGKIVAEKSY